MSKLAKTYWLIVTSAGFCLSALVLSGWRPAPGDRTRLAMYMIAAVITSGMKVRLPGIFSSLSMNYVFIVAGLLDFELSGGLLIGIAGVVGQSYYKCEKRPEWHHLLFNLANVSLSAGAANWCKDLPCIAPIDRFGVFAIVSASLAFFAFNTIVLSGIIAFTSGQTPFAVWRSSFLWTFPQYLVGGLIATCFHLLIKSTGMAGMLFTFPVIYLLYRSYDIYLTRVNDQQKHIGEMAQLHLRTIEALALAIDAKDDTTAAHLRRVQIYASEVGKELKISELEMQALEAAALLHDIGKLAVPEYIISKPGRLTPDEFEKMKIHPIVGAEILERVNFPYPVVPIVRAHHEKYDGSGYPDGLKGEEIPIGARILSAVDCLDALASDRQYRSALPLDEAIQIVVGESGKSYDPKVVEIIQSRYKELEAKAKAEADTCDHGKVSTNVKVERGSGPATGFAETANFSGYPAGGKTQSSSFSMRISDARREFQMLVDVANDLGSSLSLDETLALLAVRLEKSIPFDAVVFYMRQQNDLVPRYVKGESFRLLSSLRIPIGHGLSGWVAENHLPIVNGNPAVEAGYLNDPTKVTPLRSAIAVPLQCRDQVVGVLTLYQLQGDAFTQDHKRILMNISAKAGVVIDNALKFEQVRDEARLDELTGLLNSRSLFEQLDQQMNACVERGGSLAVIVMDLDGFKKANDEHGHLAGNRVLQFVASGLKKCCRATDLVARLGGDEFVVAMPDPGKELNGLLERIAEVGVRAGAEIGCNSPLSISAGCAVYPADASDAEGLLEKADERMYEDKRKRKAALAQNLVVFPKNAGQPRASPKSHARA
jgi:diguanylate cyclase (GGDEF)-like protein/putative nucleotidyltransferase with HDIG domain